MIDTLDHLTKTDLDAHCLALSWGTPMTTIKLVRVKPCLWLQCGGSVLCWGEGDRRCLLCCRRPDKSNGRSRTLAAMQAQPDSHNEHEENGNGAISP